ncbi:MAG: hypothetical protein PHD82_07160 [Candidatus Riflebacteria bacterium]|nr:hypothetical protein [Candidatus Riflebacteria bacterium]
MLRLIPSRVIFFCCCLLAASPLGAAEVALVTEKKGSVTATMASDTWEVELAEILEDGVEIKVAADGSMVVIHLPTSHEYRFAGDAKAQINIGGVVGEKFSSTALQMVSGKVALSQDMANQTGAVNPERVGVMPETVPAHAPSQDEIMVPPARIRPSRPMPRMPELPSGSEITITDLSENSESGSVTQASELSSDPDDNFDRENRYSDDETAARAATQLINKNKTSADDADAGISKKAEDIADLAIDSQKASVVDSASGIYLAMPAEVFNTICSEETSFNVAGDNLSGSRINYETEGWVEIAVDCEAFSGNLSLNGNLASITFEAFAPLKPSIAAAWKLEKNGNLFQAAGMWLTLQKNGLPVSKVAPHLKRIKAAILKLNK